MTKHELIDTIVKDTKLPKKEVMTIWDGIWKHLGRGLKRDGRINVSDFGTFSVKKRAARKGRNPRTGAEIRIKASKTVGFKPAPTLKKTI